jgi:hypothetical protein
MPLSILYKTWQCLQGWMASADFVYICDGRNWQVTTLKTWCITPNQGNQMKFAFRMLAIDLAVCSTQAQPIKRAFGLNFLKETVPNSLVRGDPKCIFASFFSLRWSNLDQEKLTRKKGLRETTRKRTELFEDYAANLTY